MNICVLLLVLLSASCSFAKLENTHSAARRSLKSSLRGGIAPPPQVIPCYNPHPLSDPTYCDGTDDEGDNNYDIGGPLVNVDLPEGAYSAFPGSVVGQRDVNCTSGNYTIKFIAKEKFSSGKTIKKVKAKTLMACGTACAQEKKKRCGTFNWNKNKGKCELFTTTDIARKRKKDKASITGYLVCL